MTGPILNAEDLKALQGNSSMSIAPLEYMTPSEKRAGSFWMEQIEHGKAS